METRLLAIFVFTLCLLGSCKEDGKFHKLDSDLNSEILSLTTDSLKREFLWKIWNDDQEPRNGLPGYKIGNGRDIADPDNNDSLNLKRVEAYLKSWEYPDFRIFGEVPGGALVAAVNHAPDIETREKYFPIFYKAYRKGEITNAAFSVYLQTWHRMKNGHRIEFDRPFKTEEELKGLFEGLELNTLDLS